MPPDPETRKRGPAAKSVLHAGSFFGIIFLAEYAGVAQLVVQLICNQQVGGSNPSTSSTSEWTPLHSKSPVERPGFSHTAVSFLLLPTKLCFANFRGGPGRVWRPARWTLVRAKAPVEGPGLSSPLRRSSLPHETLLCKFSRGPRKKVPPRSLSIFPYSLFTVHFSLNRQSRFLEGKSE